MERRRSAYSKVRRFLWILPRKAMGTEGKVEMWSHTFCKKFFPLIGCAHCTPTFAGFHDRPLWLSAPSSATSGKILPAVREVFPFGLAFLVGVRCQLTRRKTCPPEQIFGNVSPRSGTIKSIKSGAKYLKPT